MTAAKSALSRIANVKVESFFVLKCLETVLDTLLISRSLVDCPDSGKVVDRRSWGGGGHDGSAAGWPPKGAGRRQVIASSTPRLVEIPAESMCSVLSG